MEEKKTKRTIKKRKKIMIAFLIVLFLLIAPGLYCGLTIQNYRIEDDRFPTGIRLALITDLHSCRYGDGERRLLEAVYEQEPDVVLLGGDIFDDVLDDRNTTDFLNGIKDRYPCYYVTGNHECWASPQEHLQKMQILEGTGIVRLRGDTELLTIRGQQLRICGVDDPDLFMVKSAYTDEDFSSFREQLSRLAAETEDDIFTLLLTHRPELYEDYQQYGYDLILSGHAHGGQWRIPGILNGLYAPDQGLIPKYAGGYYDNEETSMIVSRGLARESTLAPRIYNPPELVIIDIGVEAVP